MKAVIRIKLNPCTDLVQSVIQQRWVRGTGPDIWEVQLTMSNSEGQIRKYVFWDENKKQALSQAYKCLEQHRIPEWFPNFYMEEFGKYKDLLEDLKIYERWSESMNKVETGDRTKEQHLDLWAARMEHYKSKASALPPPSNREHVLVVEPVRKESWLKKLINVFR